MQKHEEWRPVPGYEGMYSVSDMGHVRGEARKIRGPRGSSKVLPGKALSGSLDMGGYRRVELSRNGSGTAFPISNLVALAFIGPKPAGMVVAHWDGNKENNCLANLRYATDVENTDDKRRHGTLAVGERVGIAKLTESQVRQIRADPRSQRAIAADFGLQSHSMVGRVKRGEGWVHV